MTHDDRFFNRSTPLDATEYDFHNRNWDAEYTALPQEEKRRLFRRGIYRPNYANYVTGIWMGNISRGTRSCNMRYDRDLQADYDAHPSWKKRWLDTLGFGRENYEFYLALLRDRYYECLECMRKLKACTDRREFANKGQWNEGDHPRHDDGRFRPADGSTVVATTEDNRREQDKDPGRDFTLGGGPVVRGIIEDKRHEDDKGYVPPDLEKYAVVPQMEKRIPLEEMPTEGGAEGVPMEEMPQDHPVVKTLRSKFGEEVYKALCFSPSFVRALIEDSKLPPEKQMRVAFATGDESTHRNGNVIVIGRIDKNQSLSRMIKIFSHEIGHVVTPDLMDESSEEAFIESRLLNEGVAVMMHLIVYHEIHTHADSSVKVDTLYFRDNSKDYFPIYNAYQKREITYTEAVKKIAALHEKKSPLKEGQTYRDLYREQYHKMMKRKQEEVMKKKSIDRLLKGEHKFGWK